MINMDLYSLFQTALIAIFSGLGTAVGVYFAQQGLIKKLDKLSKRVKNGMAK